MSVGISQKLLQWSHASSQSVTSTEEQQRRPPEPLGTSSESAGRCELARTHSSCLLLAGSAMKDGAASAHRWAGIGGPIELVGGISFNGRLSVRVRLFSLQVRECTGVCVRACVCAPAAMMAPGPQRIPSVAWGGPMRKRADALVLAMRGAHALPRRCASLEWPSELGEAAAAVEVRLCSAWRNSWASAIAQAPPPPPNSSSPGQNSLRQLIHRNSHHSRPILIKAGRPRLVSN